MKQYISQLADKLQISTSDSGLIIWKIFLNLCTFAIYIEISLELFNLEEFQRESRGNLFLIWRMFVLSFLIIDMIISLFIDYISENGIIIQKPYKKVKYYFRHYFIFDLIVLIYLFVSTFQALPFWVGFVVFLKIPSNLYSDKITEEYLIQFQFLLLCYRILKLLIILLYVFDIFACSFYAMGLYSISIQEPTWLQYQNSVIGNIQDMHHLTQFIISYFWAVETLVSMGYGEITPMNQYEIIIGDLALVGCMFVCLYVISSILSFQTDNSSYLDENILSIKQFMIAKKISKKLYHEVSLFLSQYRMEQSKRDISEEKVVIQRLPNILKSKLHYEANLKIISKIQWIYKNFSNKFIEDLCSFINEIYLNANTPISVIGDDDDPKLYIIQKGKVAIIFKEKEIYQLYKGHSFGTYSFFKQEKEQFIQYKTKSIVILQYIKFKDFKNIIKNHFEDHEKFHFILDKVLFEKQYSLIQYGCYICTSTQHLTENCQEISIKDQIQEELYKNPYGNQNQKRKRFVRIKKKHQRWIYDKNSYDIQNQISVQFEIDKRYYSKLLLRWYPFLVHQQNRMKILLKDLLKESLQQDDLIIMTNNIIRRKKKSSVFSSSNQYLFYWQLFMMIVNALFFISIPQIIFFWNYYQQFSNQGAFKIIRIIIIVLFISDFIVQFNINYYHEGVLVKNRFKIAKKYLQNNLIFDLIPILVLFYISVTDKYVIVYLFCLVKLIPFYRFQVYLSDKLKIMPQQRQFYMIIGMLVEIIYINHFYGCMFYGGSVYMYTYYPDSKCWVNDPTMNFGVVITQNNSKKYLYSTYWAIDAITRIGYGDILPLNDLEFLITDLTVITAVAIVAVNISLIENMRKNSKLQNYYVDNLWIQQYLRKKYCSEDLKVQISNYLRYYHSIGQDRNIDIEQESLKLLPGILKQQVMQEAYGIILNKQLWLRDNSIIFELSNKVKEIYLGDMENIFLDNMPDQGQSLYYLEKGHVELFINIQYSFRKETNIALLQRESFFGHYSFMTGLPRKASARTKQFASLIYIQRKEFHDVLEMNKNFHHQFQVLRDSIIYENQFQLIGLQCFTCHGSDHLSIDCPLTSIKKQMQIRFYHSIKEKSQSGFNIRKLYNQEIQQERRLFKRKNIQKTKTIRNQEFEYTFEYIIPRATINYVIDKDLHLI